MASLTEAIVRHLNTAAVPMASFQRMGLISKTAGSSTPKTALSRTLAVVLMESLLVKSNLKIKDESVLGLKIGKS